MAGCLVNGKSGQSAGVDDAVCIERQRHVAPMFYRFYPYLRPFTHTISEAACVRVRGSDMAVKLENRCFILQSANKLPERFEVLFIAVVEISG
jgi:hypothetical protein